MCVLDLLSHRFLICAGIRLRDVGGGQVGQCEWLKGRERGSSEH